jgi:hypothetical protein
VIPEIPLVRRPRRRPTRGAGLGRYGLLVPVGAAVAIAYVARHHHGPSRAAVAPRPATAEPGPELEAYGVEEFDEFSDSGEEFSELDAYDEPV